MLWQSGAEISGKLLNDRLEAAGAAFQIPAHDFYVRPGELATDPTGGFLFSEAENAAGVGTQTRVFVTRISADGQPLNTASWLVIDDSRQFNSRRPTRCMSPIRGGTWSRGRYMARRVPGGLRPSECLGSAAADPPVEPGPRTSAVMDSYGRSAPPMESAERSASRATQETRL